MPGRRLSHRERNLLEAWKAPPLEFPGPLLKAVSILGPPTLRGIERIRVPFNYPITAISGKNGVGKSTILGLAAFSARRPDGWRPRLWPTAPNRRLIKTYAYRWDDFFLRRRGDPPHNGLRIQFDYFVDGNDLAFTRNYENSLWRTLPDPGRSSPRSFPKRAIEFVSLARVIPPAELAHIRRYFFEYGDPPRITPLAAEMREAMNTIFRQNYQSIEVHSRLGMDLAICRSGADYTGFDMGAGENAMIAILARLQRLPAGGLLIVEEIEHGLHPEAQLSLVEALTEVVRSKNQQIIFTTHSSHIIDRLPREGRILLDKVAGAHRTVQAPTTRLATANMTGLAHPEATVYVEDNFGSSLLTHALTREQRGRVNIVPIGDTSRVATQLGAHRRGNHPGPAICVFDGDCNDGEIERWRRREDLPDNEDLFHQLPGDDAPPEIWTLTVLQDEPFLTKFADRVGCDAAEALEEIRRALALPDHHDIPYELANSMSLTEDDMVSILTSVAASRNPEFDDLRNKIDGMLNGD